MFVYIDDREDEELDDYKNEESEGSHDYEYGYDYGGEEYTYETNECDDSYFK